MHCMDILWKLYKARSNIRKSGAETEETRQDRLLVGSIRAALSDMTTLQVVKLLLSGPRIVYLGPSGPDSSAGLAAEAAAKLRLTYLALDIKQPLSDWLTAIRKFKPTIVIGYPSAIKILGELVEGGQIKSDISRVITWGEPLSVGLRSYVERIFGADVVQHPLSKVESMVGKSEDLLWFEDENGIRDFLHPLTLEGFCVVGLNAYQFRQVNATEFIVLAETAEQSGQQEIQTELCQKIRMVLEEKRLSYVKFTISFTDYISPDAVTGRKRLVVNNYFRRVV